MITAGSKIHPVLKSGVAQFQLVHNRHLKARETPVQVAVEKITSNDYRTVESSVEMSEVNP
jgi:hypothetical protein